jgi:hypothetical protein
LDDQRIWSELGDSAMLDNLQCTKQLAQFIKLALVSGGARRLGELGQEHWLHKKRTVAANVQ